ncbi:MAG: DUF6273 domain-containing protein [bacterium]|nr:DUF6273 domain-containing protein [bacterium]
MTGFANNASGDASFVDNNVMSGTSVANADVDSAEADAAFAEGTAADGNAANADAATADVDVTAAYTNAASTPGEAAPTGAATAEAAPAVDASAEAAPTESTSAETAPAEAGDSAVDGLTSKLAIIAGIASLVAVGVVVFFSLRGAVYYDALKGPIIKNTYVRFGRYIQNDKEPEPIVWLVADIQDGEALLISRKILDWKEFNKDYVPEEEGMVWAISSLREYLNNDFYNAAFNDEEKARICVSHLNNLPSPSNYKGRRNRDSGPDTDDRIFIPSYYELNELKPPISRKKKGRALYVDNSWRVDGSCATDKAIKEGASRARFNYFFFSRKGYYPYWLRTSGSFGYGIMTLENWVSSRRYTSKCGVRPALRMRVK